MDAQRHRTHKVQFPPLCHRLFVRLGSRLRSLQTRVQHTTTRVDDVAPWPDHCAPRQHYPDFLKGDFVVFARSFSAAVPSSFAHVGRKKRSCEVVNKQIMDVRMNMLSSSRSWGPITLPDSICEYVQLDYSYRLVFNLLKEIKRKFRSWLIKKEKKKWPFVVSYELVYNWLESTDGLPIFLPSCFSSGHHRNLSTITNGPPFFCMVEG